MVWKEQSFLNYRYEPSVNGFGALEAVSTGCQKNFFYPFLLQGEKTKNFVTFFALMFVFWNTPKTSYGF